jgi:outer membrane protein assembly factor BamA
MKIFSYKLFFYTLVFISFLGVNPGVFGQEDKIELNSIDFIGNEFFSNSELEEIIISKESPNWLSQFLDSFTSFGNPASYFDSLDLQDDLSILRNHYFFRF